MSKSTNHHTGYYNPLHRGEVDDPPKYKEFLIPPEEESEGFHDATIFSSFVNLTNSIIGSGILGLPYAFASAGWVLGFSLIGTVAILTIFSLHLLSICATKVHPPSSFYKVANASIPRWTFLIDLSVALMCFGVSLSYLIVISGLMPDVMRQFGGEGVWLNRQLWVGVGCIIVAPLSYLKNLDALKWTSLMAIIFVMFVSFVILLYAVDDDLNACSDDSECPGRKMLASVTGNTLRNLGVFVFAFGCQMNLFPVVNELREPTQRRFDTVFCLAMFTAFCLYAVVAASGYSTFGDAVDSDVLVSYPINSLTSIARISISLLVAFSYPVLCNPGRASFMALWKMMDSDDVAAVQNEQSRFYIITTCYVFGTVGIAMVYSDFGVVLSVIGCTASSIISFILPGAAYYQMHYDDPDAPAWKLWGGLGLFGLGMFIMPVCLTFIFI